MRFDILSLFPGFFKGPFSESLIKRALAKGLLEIGLVDIRDFANNKWRRVDDRPYGGGPGMVLMAEPVVKAIRSVRKEKSHVIYLSPQGTPLTAAKARSLATQSDHIILLAGHYEGIDERALKEVNEEISIGDYILTNGCLAAMVLLDAVMRFVPGFIGDERASSQDSFEEAVGGYFDWPHYTTPEEFEGEKVPQVLRSGNHKEIEKWRKNAALKKTEKVRPDLAKKVILGENHEQTSSDPEIRKGTAQKKSRPI